MNSNIVNNMVASFAVGLVDVSGKLPPLENEYLDGLRYGASFTVASDLVRYFQTGQSKLVSMDYYGLMDDLVFDTALITVANKSGITKSVFNLVNTMTPVKNELLVDAVVDGVLMSVGNILADTLDNTPVVVQTPLKYLNHSSLLFRS
jgi:hypothetical protein